MIVLDLEIPKSCSDCNFCCSKGKSNPWDFACYADADLMDIDINIYSDCRPHNCPIHEGIMEKDVISRQALLSEIETVCFSKEWIKFRADYGRNGTRDYIINYIKQMPSVKPEQIKCS